MKKKLIPIVIIIAIICFYTFIKINNIQISKKLNSKNMSKMKDSKSIQAVQTKHKKANQNKFKMPTTKEIIGKMSSDEFNGRYLKSKGNKLATYYIENLFKQLKLKPVFKSSYLHKFEFYNIYYNEKNRQNKKSEEKLQFNNVVGKISGKNNKKAIIIGAHFDAVGKTPDGFYRGSLDNASGVATILKTAYNLKKNNNCLNSDVIICAFNAEQTGCIKGSKEFVKDIKHLYNDIFYINVDCVGAKEAGPLALKNISKVKKSSELYDGIKETFKKQNIDFKNIVSSKKVQYAAEHNSGVSDYKYFEKNNIPNIHIAQSNISKLILKTTERPEMLDFNKIDKLAYALSYFIQNNKLS